VAQENGLAIDHIRKADFRKEQRVKEILAQRGNHPGPVHIFSAIEPCPSFKPWEDKKTGKTLRRHTDGKGLPAYFYFLREDLGFSIVSPEQSSKRITPLCFFMISLTSGFTSFPHQILH
jgi:hypothetical protein